MRAASAVTAVLLAIVVVVHATAQNGTSTGTYHHELSGFRFYGKHLFPLRPHVSDRAAVVTVLGSDQGKTVDGWRLRPLFVGDPGPTNGRLAEIHVIPNKRISMLQVKFPSTFKHSIGFVSESNVICDVYAVSEGLQYWVYAENSAVAKKGDLMHIVYGAAEPPKSSQVPAGPHRLQIPSKVAETMLCGSDEPSRDGVTHLNQQNSICGPPVHPLYPPEAKKQGIQGTVYLRAIIGDDGLVKEVRVLAGHPMLTSSAIEAVKRWRYQPYLVAGSPVEVETTIVVNFTLKKDN